MSQAVFNKLALFKTRTKLLAIFALMFAGLFYLNAMIVKQTNSVNTFIEKQGVIIAHHTQLSDTVSCFGNIKYWFAFLDNRLNSGEGVAQKENSAEDQLKCS